MRKYLLAVFLLFLPTLAWAQAPVIVQCYNSNTPANPWQPCSTSNPLPVSVGGSGPGAPVITGANPLDIASATLTRPSNTTTYTADTIICQSTTAASCSGLSIALGRSATNNAVRITGFKISITGDTTWFSTPATVRIHVYQSSPTFENGDNGAFNAGIEQGSNPMGYADCSINIEEYNGSADVLSGFCTPVLGVMDAVAGSGSQNLYLVLETRTALTPASGDSFIVTAFGYQMN